MFKTPSFEDEIFQSMEKQLVSNQLESHYGLNKLARATECLHAAAEIFEQAEMYDVSNEVLKVIEDLIKVVK